MGDDAFSEMLLTEKLLRLNSSQQRIESLSKLCVSHRNKAKKVVETWERVFESAPREQQVSFLYLANDILQNSRRQGWEFVLEFWNILPAALKDFYDNGDENCRKVALRLVDIWEERKVFGSRGQNLKNDFLSGKHPFVGKNSSPVDDGKNSKPIMVVNRDASSLRINVAVGGFPEKILTAFQSVHAETVNEEEALSNCRNAISCLQELEKDVANASSQGNQLGSNVMDYITQQENMLQQCITQLENSGSTRVALISQLKEALEDEEAKLEVIQSELLVARGQVEKAANMRLPSTPTFSAPSITNKLTFESPPFPYLQPTNNPTATPSAHPSTLFTNSIVKEENTKATVAEVAAKLTASTCSAQVLSSVISSLFAEDVASVSSGLKKPKLDKPFSFFNMNSSEGSSSAYFPSTQQSATNLLPVQANSALSTYQLNQSQPPLLPLPANYPVSMGLPFGYGATNLRPTTLSPNAAVGLVRPGPHPQQVQNQQAANGGGYYRPVGIGFLGQTTHQPTTPQMHRQ